jgi:hypothetical protein
MLVKRSIPAAFCAGAIVREQEHNGVVGFPDLVKKGQESADLSVGMSKETGEDFLAPGVHPLFV